MLTMFLIECAHLNQSEGQNLHKTLHMLKNAHQKLL